MINQLASEQFPVSSFPVKALDVANFAGESQEWKFWGRWNNLGVTGIQQTASVECSRFLFDQRSLMWQTGGKTETDLIGACSSQVNAASIRQKKSVKASIFQKCWWNSNKIWIVMSYKQRVWSSKFAYNSSRWRRVLNASRQFIVTGPLMPKVLVPLLLEAKFQ